MVRRRPLSPAQRSAKNERDRRRRREHNINKVGVEETSERGGQVPGNSSCVGRIAGQIHGSKKHCFPVSRGEQKVDRYRAVSSLVPVHETLKKAYRDITAESNQSIPVIRDSYILFCSVIREMNELRLEEIDLEKMILWKDAINSCLSIGIKGSFAIEHLKKIARTYFGSRNKQELKSMEERMLKLKAELYALEKKHNCIAEKQSSEMLQGCLPDANFFQGKPLGSGLFV